VSSWRVEETPNGLHLTPVVRRGPLAEGLTWADLLHFRLRAVRVFVLYFPSRFDLAVDAAAKAALEVFGRQTGPGTSVNFWDPADPEFSRALAFFQVAAPPALVLATGLKADGGQLPDRGDVYALAITDSRVLTDRERLAGAVNTAHEVLMRGDRNEIARYVRERAAGSLLDALGRLAGRLRDELVKLKPKFVLPGGFSLEVG
jgi:hypothetical protein